MKTSVIAFHWLPRIICLLAILWISLFAADAFAPGLIIWQELRDFFMHLIPSFILLALLMMAWKWEFIGGILFTVLGIGLSPFIFQHNYNINHSIGISLGVILAINLPFVIVGILFIVSHYTRKNRFQRA